MPESMSVTSSPSSASRIFGRTAHAPERAATPEPAIHPERHIGATAKLVERMGGFAARFGHKEQVSPSATAEAQQSGSSSLRYEIGPIADGDVAAKRRAELAAAIDIEAEARAGRPHQVGDFIDSLTRDPGVVKLMQMLTDANLPAFRSSQAPHWAPYDNGGERAFVVAGNLLLTSTGFVMRREESTPEKKSFVEHRRTTFVDVTTDELAKTSWIDQDKIREGLEQVLAAALASAAGESSWELMKRTAFSGAWLYRPAQE